MENRIDLISLKVCKEKSLKYSNKVISNPYSAYEIIKRFIGITDREYFGVLMMNNANEVCSLQICSIGSIDTTIVHPREVFKGAIQTNASRIILFHTHPSNTAQPSPCDIKVTENLMNVSKILQIPLIDHIIVCADNYYSFLEKGILFEGNDK